MHRRDLWLWVAILALDLFLVFLNGNTYDSGDSILHYLHSKQAFAHPGYFFSHWSKPVFVLLSAPLAHWGWWGIKLFNALCVLLSSFLLWKLFEHYGLRAWLGMAFCFGAPALILVQSSGLTEPLFMCLLLWVVYLLHRQRWIAGVLVLSFLPYARSEGWVIVIIVAVFLLQIGRWRLLPYLFAGTLCYTVTGGWYHGDILWLWHQHSYLGFEPKYGSGSALHYVEQLPYIVGLPIHILFFIGLYDGVLRIMRNRMAYPEFFLIYGISVGYLVAHSIFWSQGWFHSLGLNRVLIVLVPLIAFIAYRGLERLSCALYFIPARWLRVAVVATVLIFPFTANKAALDLPGSFVQEPEQGMMDQVKAYCDSAYGPQRIYYANTYLPMVFEADIDRGEEALHIGLIKEFGVEPGSLVLWDSYYAVSDQGVYAKDLHERSDLLFIRRFSCTECERPYFVDLYRSRD